MTKINWNIIKWMIIVVALSFVTTSSHAQTKRALLVGISNYSTNSATQWTDIHGANDVELIAITLKSQKFKITKVTNQQSTAKRIRKELKSLANSCKPGDLVYIHFSGHGQPFDDKSGDEEDGWDEAIIPYDAQKVYSKGKYEGANHIIDDELNGYFNQIRKKVGAKGFLCVVIDACHSGNTYKGDEIEDGEEIYIRGTRDGFSSSGKPFRPRINADSNYKKYKYGIEQKAGFANILILEACRSYQSNHEIKQDGKHYGPLSYYVNKTLQTKNLAPSLSWVNEVKRLMDRDSRLSRQQMIFETSLK